MFEKKLKRFTVKLDNIPRSHPYPLKLMHVGYFPESTIDLCVKHSNINFGLRYSSVEKELEFQADGQHYALKLPCVVITIPGVIYKQTGIFEEFYVTYPADTAPVIRQFSIPLNCYGWHFEHTSDIEGIINKINRLVKHVHEKGMIERVERCVEMLIAETLLYSDAHLKIQPTEKAVRSIASYLSVNYNKDCDIDNLIKRKGLSRRSFYRYWRQLYCVSPYQYMLSLKIEEAKRLLTCTTMKINEVAYELNFKDPMHFSSLFRKTTTMSPTRFRESFL